MGLAMGHMGLAMGTYGLSYGTYGVMLARRIYSLVGLRLLRAPHGELLL